MTPEFLTHVAALIVGAVASYFGAMNAMRERLAKLEARADANKESSANAYEHAQGAHSRIDAMMQK